MGLVIIIGVLVTICVSSILIPALIVLIIPGRKGTLRTTREFRFPGKIEEAFSLMRGRIEYEGFITDSASPPRVLTAHRPARHHEVDESTIVTHATKPLGLEAHFEPVPGGAMVRLTMWMKDFVLLDSGEGRQIDLTLDRLIKAELDKEPPPVTPSTSLNAFCAVTAGLVTIALAALPFYWPWLRQKHLFAFGLAIAGGGLFAASMGWETIKAVRAKPLEVKGTGLAYLSHVLAAIAVVAGVAWSLDGLIQWFSR